MTDYISRADAIEAVCRTRCGDKAKGCPAHSCLVIEEFDALPSADAEQIVYCMDCAKSVPLDEHGALWKCKAHDRSTLRHSYCNNGERKGGDTE